MRNRILWISLLGLLSTTIAESLLLVQTRHELRDERATQQKRYDWITLTMGNLINDGKNRYNDVVGLQKSVVGLQQAITALDRRRPSVIVEATETEEEEWKEEQVSEPVSVTTDCYTNSDGDRLHCRTVPDP